MVQASTANGFKGVLFWAYNDPSTHVTSADLAALREFSDSHDLSYQAVLAYLNAPTPPPTPPPCTDNSPGGGPTCAQQKGWGKCGESWMKGFCCKSCFQCSPDCGR